MYLSPAIAEGATAPLSGRILLKCYHQRESKFQTAERKFQIGMSDTHITVHIEQPGAEPGPIQGFKFFWAYYVNGFDQTTHCQFCFKGSLSRQFNTRTVQSGKLYTMNERKSFRYLYICGVGLGPKDLLHEKNFHLPLELRPGGREIRRTYNGYTITAENAIALPIPELEEGWHGLDRETTRCKNFRFAVGQFGWTEQPAAQ